MSTPFKLSLAIVFVAGLLVFGKLFYQAYNEFTNRPDSRMEIDFSDNRPDTPSRTPSDQPGPEPTDGLPSSPETPEPAAAVGSPDKAQGTVAGSEPQSKDTRQKIGQTNATAPSNSASPRTPLKTATNLSSKLQDTKILDGQKPAAKGSKSSIGIHAACFLGCLVGLAVLSGHAFSQYVGQKAIKTIYNDEGEGMANPGYDEAEQEWADGNHLEAIRLMRAYLTKNPREQHVALRIAEIYEKDLKNALAAALEYEEVLTKKLSPERWGWAAIHLCNLYYKLNKPDKAFMLLKRIDVEYGQTAAASKARKRLALIDADGGQAPPTEEMSGEG